MRCDRKFRLRRETPSERIRRNHFSPATSPKRLIGRGTDATFQKMDGAVGEQEIYSSRMSAPVVLNMRSRVIGSAGKIIQPDRAKDHREGLFGIDLKRIGAPFDR